MILLGIETSCDETACAIVNDQRQILANVILSQIDEHRPFLGVVPEIAARAHIDHLDRVIAAALREAGLRLPEIDAVAVTAGPGLIGGVIVGVMTAKAIASVHGKPFIAVNHLEGHALTARLTDPSLEFPFLLLLVSGGHCQLLMVEGVGRYVKLGATVDDALGEAFDKTAKLLGLPYPGGPQVEALARSGNPVRFDLPRPLKGREGCDFSFSGLKTAVRNLVAGLGALSEQDKADICASFQAAVGDVVADRTRAAIRQFKAKHGGGEALVVAGGVAANQYLRGILTGLADAEGMRFTAPPLALCTDNAAMIAWAGAERFGLGQSDSLEFEPRARWAL